MGAWQHKYRMGMAVEAGTDLAAGVRAIKQELNYNGYHCNIDSVEIGATADRAIRDFQLGAHLHVDGVVGPATAGMLFRARASALETYHRIPAGVLQRLKTVESSNDPIATNVDESHAGHHDGGLVQINDYYHPTMVQARFDPAKALPWACNYLRAGFERFHDWDVAIASYNVGYGGAATWQRLGKPADSRAQKYVDAVRHAPLSWR